MCDKSGDTFFNVRVLELGKVDVRQELDDEVGDPIFPRDSRMTQTARDIRT